MSLSLSVDSLLSYPACMWHENPSKRWIDLCTRLKEYEATADCLGILQDRERKWELVSSYQKIVRRGLADLSPWLVSEFLSLGRMEWAYCWRRICVTAAEDVGFADPELMNFVIACSTLFRPSAGPEALRNVWEFLTKEMCRAQRSRVYCQLALVSDGIKRGDLSGVMSSWEQAIIEELKARPSVTDGDQCTAKTKWALKNDWRADGMLKFQATIQTAFEVHATGPDVAYQLLSGLPDFSYDKHTRSGKAVCARLARYGAIRKFLNEHPPRGIRNAAVAWGLFFAEGCRIAGGLEDARLTVLEAKAMAGLLGWEMDTWRELVHLVNGAVSLGIVNQIRKAVLSSSLAQRSSCQPKSMKLFE